MKSLILVILIASIALAEVSYEKCDYKNNYLQSKIKGFVNTNPSFISCRFKDSSLTVMPTVENRKEVYQVVLRQSPLSLCILHSMKKSVPPGRKLITPNKFPGNLHYINCENAETSPPVRSYEESSKYLLDKRQAKYDYHIADLGKIYNNPSSKCQDNDACREALSLLNTQKKLWANTGKKKTMPAALPAPCVSQDYHQLMFSSFQNVSSCVGLSEKEKWDYYKILNHESGFMVNKVSPTKAIGVGQITTGTVQEIERVYPNLEEMHDDNENCKLFPNTIKTPLGYDKTKKEGGINECSRASLPYNPVRNILYGSLLFKYYKKRTTQFYNIMFNNKNGNGVASISKSDREKIITLITTIMYNSGDTSMRNSCLKFIRQAKWNGLQGANVTFPTFKKNFINFLSTNHSSRRSEVSGYQEKIEEQIETVEKDVQRKNPGVRCSP